MEQVMIFGRNERKVSHSAGFIVSIADLQLIHTRTGDASPIALHAFSSAVPTSCSRYRLIRSTSGSGEVGRRGIRMMPSLRIPLKHIIDWHW